MAAVMIRRCHDYEDTKGTCERPEYPNWIWRFNRNQHMTHYNSWFTREEQKPPQYRNMGMHEDFRFHPMTPCDGPAPMQQLGVTYCHKLANNRQAGFGNSAFGKSPGPAPPRLFAYQMAIKDEIYEVNDVYPISRGMSMFGYDHLALSGLENRLPRTPSHYMEATLGQVAEIPGTFPHFNKSLPGLTSRLSSFCATQPPPCDPSGSRNIMEAWQKRYRMVQAANAIERCCLDYSKAQTQTPTECYRQPTVRVRRV